MCVIIVSSAQHVVGRVPSSYAELAMTLGPDTRPFTVPWLSPQPCGRWCLFCPGSVLLVLGCLPAAVQSSGQEPPRVVSAAPSSRPRWDYSCSHQCVFRAHSVPGSVLGAAGGGSEHTEEVIRRSLDSVGGAGATSGGPPGEEHLSGIRQSCLCWASGRTFRHRE